MGYKIREEVLALRPYVAGKPISEVKRELGLTEVVKMASNENPLGCSPKVKDALRAIIDDTNLYPDAANFELKGIIAEKLKVKREQIFCGTGSDSLIKVICSTFLNCGDESIMADITFPQYQTYTQLAGGKPVIVPLKDHKFDLETMVEAITDKTKIIWLCNPNNPTGTIFRKDELSKIIDKIPSSVIIVMDEAYKEYVTDEAYPDSLGMLDSYPNMIILRTFSKAYGLASLRCGYGVASEDMVKYFNSVIGPFDVNLYAQTAAAAAMKDEEFLKLVHETNKEGKEYLYNSFEEMNLPYVESNANFIMVNTKTDDKEVFNKLLKNGYIVRPGYLLGMPGWLRVTIGTGKQNKKFVELLKQAL